jgi:hypothetical protein
MAYGEAMHVNRTATAKAIDFITLVRLRGDTYLIATLFGTD